MLFTVRNPLGDIFKTPKQLKMSENVYSAARLGDFSKNQ